MSPFADPGENLNIINPKFQLTTDRRMKFFINSKQKKNNSSGDTWESKGSNSPTRRVKNIYVRSRFSTTAVQNN